MKLRTIEMAPVAALALIATRAQGDESAALTSAPFKLGDRDVGWNTKYGREGERLRRLQVARGEPVRS
jgi:hypothetical protein